MRSTKLTEKFMYWRNLIKPELKTVSQLGIKIVLSYGVAAIQWITCVIKIVEPHVK